MEAGQEALWVSLDGWGVLYAGERRFELDQAAINGLDRIEDRLDLTL